ncbi:reverse transcriptase [Phytophthora megakarya]|uniref:Reverse transcriptase n=1 Tax=Phytophthora megakarya TaxID=4795 RepID=A0A225VBL8_9STRA|nr:reverse transcriptase [Phytophthora megakarya]
MCVDYRLVNQLIKLSRYPLPLIDDLLTDFNAAAWFMSLDMASGFCAIQMTERVKLISAFVCPFGHFQWIWMPLDSRTLVYQSVMNNCIWGFVRLPPEEDRDVLEFLKLTVPDTGPTIEDPQGEGGFRLPELMKEATAFRRNIPTPTQMGPVLERSFYIGDIAHGAPTWDTLCEDLNALLFRLRYWNISVICAKGIRATPKIAKSVQDLPFVIQQAQGLIGCHQPNRQRRLAAYEALKGKFGSVQLVHVKRDYNQATDYVTTKTLALEKAWVVEDADELMYLKFVSRIPENIMKTPETSEQIHDASQSLKRYRSSGLISDPAQTRLRHQVAQVDDPSRPLDYRDERWRRIKVHQDEDPELKRLKDYLKGDLLNYTRKEVKKIAKGSYPYVLDSRDVLYRLAVTTPERPRDKRSELRLVVPEALRPDILHHAHEDFQSGHQGITRTYERLRSEFFLTGMFQDVGMFVKELLALVPRI